MSHDSSLTFITLPKEIILNHILPFLKLSKVLELFSIENEYLQELLEKYMEMYMRDGHYKSTLSDALILLEYEHFYNPVLEFFTAYFSELAIKFVQLVKEAGGAVHCHNLSLEESPRAIYTISVIMQRNENELVYKITNLTFMSGQAKCTSTFSIDNVPDTSTVIDTNSNDINIELVSIFNIMGTDPARKIKRIELNKEVYQQGFMISHQLPEIVNISKYE